MVNECFWFDELYIFDDVMVCDFNGVVCNEFKMLSKENVEYVVCYLVMVLWFIDEDFVFVYEYVLVVF